jgi:hypothetical protein
MRILDNVAVQWLIRRIPEVGGLLLTIVTFFAAIPPEQQAVLIAILTGQGGGLTIGAVIGLAMWVYAQIVSFQQTTKPKEVEKIGGKPVEVSSGPKSLFDILRGK